MNELQGRLPHIEARKDALISAQTFEKYARLVRNMTVLGGTLGVNGRGGLEITVTPSQGGGGGGTTYAGPFALSYANGTATIAYGYIIAGTTSQAVSQSTLQVTLPMSPNLAYIYIDVSSPSAGNISTNYGSDVSIAVAHGQTDAVFRVCIGTVDASGACVQWQHGDIYVSGRLV